MRDDEEIEAAIGFGRKQAEEALKFQNAELDSRRRALKQFGADPSSPADSARIEAAGGRENAGWLVAEGDSWFNYPWTDILGKLRHEHGYEIVSSAHWGDRVEGMAYDAGQLVTFLGNIETVLRQGHIPKAILLSGGGNDIAGDEFEMLLNHANSPRRGVSDSVLRGVIDERVKLSYVTILAEVTRLCEARLGKTIPIVIHGYDHPIPDGRGVAGGWWKLPGPWLKPGFDLKGFDDRAETTAMMHDIIERFNGMLKALVALPQFQHVRYADLRGTLKGEDWNWWANELHPERDGFSAIAKKIATQIQSAPVPMPAHTAAPGDAAPVAVKKPRMADALPESADKLRERARVSAEELQRVTVAIPIASLGVFFVALTQKVEPALTPTERFFLLVGIFGMAVAAFCSIFTWIADSKWNAGLAEVKEKEGTAGAEKREKRVDFWMGAENVAGILFLLSFCPALVATAFYVWLRAK